MLENEEIQGENAPQADRKELLLEQFNAVETPDPVVTEAKVSEERPRDEKGKFAPKEAKEPELPLEAQTQEVKEPPVWERPPASWKKDYHEVWKSADPKLREYAYQREEQMRAGIEPLIPKAKFADEVQKVLEPYMGTLRGLGVSPPQAIEALIRTDHTLRNSSPQERRQLFLNLAAQYGVNLSPVEGEQFQQPSIPPEVFQLKNELTNIRGELLSFKEQQELALNQQLQGEIDRFSRTAEFFEQARPTMTTLLQSGVATDLQDAYDKAIRLDPELFETVQSRKQAESAASMVAAKNTAAKQAKAAAVSVRSSTPGTKTTTTAQDRRSKLLEQFDSLSDRL